jgi:hypothetical protein
MDSAILTFFPELERELRLERVLGGCLAVLVEPLGTGAFGGLAGEIGRTIEYALAERGRLGLKKSG